MSQTGVIVCAILVAFFVYITIKGQLGAYISMVV